MKIINNSKELKKLVNEFNDLILDEDVKITFEPTKDELRDVKCHNFTLMNDRQRFDFNGRNFNGWNFNGWNFNGRNFDGWSFDGEDFDGWSFNGGNFNGKKISYYAFFNCYDSIKCTSWEKRRENAQDPVCLDGGIELVSEEDNDVLKAINLLEKKGKLKNGKILI